MPSRILREGILDSDRVNSLDWAAEVFYRRLMSKVDDFGLYDARPSMLRASLYPIGTDRVREADISRWIAACETAGLILLYETDGKPYLRMLDTRWQARSDPKYPLPPESTCEQLRTPVTVVEDVVVVEDVDTLSGKPDAAPHGKGLNGYRGDAAAILTFLNQKTGRHFEPVEANLKPIAARLKEGATPDDVRAVIAKKCREWGADERMAHYLRPKTLFNATNFANYKGELTREMP